MADEGVGEDSVLGNEHRVAQPSVERLVLERKGQPNKTRVLDTASARLLMSPPLGEDYWLYRVRLSDRQAIVGFPKYTTIGVGFAVEDDWNTNLPYRQPAEDIYDHIKHNKGDDGIADADCLAAIRPVQEAATADRAAPQTVPGDDATTPNTDSSPDQTAVGATDAARER